MPSAIANRKRFLFVDDDPQFLAGIRQLFTEKSHGRWEVLTAENHAQALALLSKQRMELVVLDIGMPVMDGIQFLQLLGRTHPGQAVAMLTGRSSEERRRLSLASGAVLYLEKPLSADGFEAVFAALDSVAGTQPQAGFQGMMRRIGLQDVLQMECLARKSSVLEIFTGQAGGRIFICDGSIVHAECGTVRGEGALYSLLGLRGGAFNLAPFVEPPQRSIEGQWEFLLMEAARINDEAAPTLPPQQTPSPAPESPALSGEVGPEASDTRVPPPSPVRIDEILLTSGAGEVLFDSKCQSPDNRMQLLTQLEEMGRQLSALAPIGRFERLEIRAAAGERAVCLVRPDRRLFVRSATAVAELV